jgi:HSP20 family molecular chaperone IbpA
MVFCDYCNTKVDKKWNYCPKCGNRLSASTNLTDLISRQMDYFKKMLDITGYDISVQPESDNTFVINISQGLDNVSPTVKVGRPANKHKNNKNIQQMKLPKKTLEPEISIKRKRGRLQVTARLPGIRSEDSIEITRMDNSIELRAKKGKLGYFKILKIPARYRLVERKIINENLILEFLLN